MSSIPKKSREMISHLQCPVILINVSFAKIAYIIDIIKGLQIDLLEVSVYLSGHVPSI